MLCDLFVAQSVSGLVFGTAELREHVGAVTPPPRLDLRCKVSLEKSAPAHASPVAARRHRPPHHRNGRIHSVDERAAYLSARP